MTETVTLDGVQTTRWSKLEVIDSVSKGSKSFKAALENADNTLTNLYEQFDTAVIALEGTNVFNGRMEQINPNESDAVLEISGRDYLGELIGEYIIESYEISQTATNNPAAGSNVVINISNTTGFAVGDEVNISAGSTAENAVITAVVVNTSITVDSLSNSYTTPAVKVGRVGSYIVNDLVQKYGKSMTRNGIQTSTKKFLVTFKGITAFDAIQQIADAEEFEFGHDMTKDFFYQPRNFEDSGLTIELGVSDVVDFKFPRPGYEIINRVDIYGAVIGGAQIAIRKEDPSSQSYYGVIRGSTIIDEKIKTEAQAEAKADGILAQKAWVIQQGELTVIGYEALQAGQLITVKSFSGAANGTYLVIEKRHEVPPGLTYIKVAQYSTELESVIVNLIKRMREREKEALDENAALTKFMNFYMTEQHSDAIVNIIKQNINDGFIIAHKTNGRVGRGYNGVGGTQIKIGRYMTEEIIA